MTQVIDPIEVIGRARRRIAELAALRVAIYLAPPVLIALALGLGFESLGSATWERWGYMLTPSLGRGMHLGLLAAAAIGRGRRTDSMAGLSSRERLRGSGRANRPPG